VEGLLRLHASTTPRASTFVHCPCAIRGPTNARSPERASQSRRQ
jgi:hypothetical protein